MAFSALNCPAVSQLLSQVQSDFGIQENLVAKYLDSSQTSVPTLMMAPPSAPVAAPPTPEKKKRQVKEKTEGEQCMATTAKGRCKFAVKCDGLCGIHLRKKEKGSATGTTEPKASKPPKVSKVPKNKAEAPRHSHPLAEEPDMTCMVCETQGNVVKPEMTTAEFEAVAEDGKSLQDRLKAILAGGNYDEDDEDDDAAATADPRREVEDNVEPEDETEIEETLTLRAKLAKMVAQDNDMDEEEEDEVDLDQMVETPPSHARLTALMNKLGVAEGREEPYNFDELEMEMED